MANNGFKVLDSDMHILEPPDLWQRYIDAKFKDYAPRGTTDHVRDLRMVGPDGQAWGRPVDPPPETIPPPGHIFHRNQQLFKTHMERGWSSQVQLEAMDEEGIDLAVLYPSRGLNVLSIPDMDPEFAAALARAYNDWLYEFCQADTSKLKGAGMISVFNLDDAISEAQRCVKQLGFRAVFLRANIVNGHNWHDPYYEPAMVGSGGAGCSPRISRIQYLGRAAGGRSIWLRLHVASYLFPPVRTDARSGELLRRRGS